MGEETQRERWSSRIAFILASVGAAIGYGNVWRFPSLVYEYGGGAFFIPYLLAFFVIGIPITILEISLGQAHQTGDMGAFGSMNQRLRGVGLTSVQNSYFIVCYYCALIAWTIRSFFDAFQNPEAWEKDGINHFVNDIIGQSSLTGDLPTRLVPENVLFLGVGWIIIFLCLAFGIKWEGRITYFTAGFPFLLLFVFLGRALTLEGSTEGIKAYIGQWDMAVLSERPDCWSKACSQVFFSVGITFGIFTAFGSHCDRKAPAFANSVIIASLDTIFAIIAGFAVYGMLGYMANLKGLDVHEISASGMTLLFGVFPEALMTLPGGIHWVRLLFFFLFLLGIDSGFALTEAVFAVIHDTIYFRPWARWKLTFALTAVAFVCGLLYVTDAGLIFLDVVDFYVNFMMLLVGFFECFAAGWMFELDEQFENVGRPTVLLYMFTTFFSVIVASIIWFAVPGIPKMVTGFIALGVIYGLGMMGVLFMCSQKASATSKSCGTVLYDLMFRNVFELKAQLSASVGYLPTWWCILIKHVIPPLLLVLFINLAASENGMGQPQLGYYGGYPMMPYQFIGILTVALTLFVIFLGFVRPSVYDIVADPEDSLRDKNAASTGEKEIDVAEKASDGTSDENIKEEPAKVEAA